MRNKSTHTAAATAATAATAANDSIVETAAATEINDKQCLICWRNIQSNKWVMCVFCNILLHDECFSQDQKINNRTYCLCPHCRKVGTLGCMYSYHNI